METAFCINDLKQTEDGRYSSTIVRILFLFLNFIFSLGDLEILIEQERQQNGSRKRKLEEERLCCAKAPSKSLKPSLLLNVARILKRIPFTKQMRILHYSLCHTDWAWQEDLIENNHRKLINICKQSIHLLHSNNGAAGIIRFRMWRQVGGKTKEDSRWRWIDGEITRRLRR